MILELTLMVSTMRHLQTFTTGDYRKATANRTAATTWYDPSLYVLGLVVGLVPIVAVLLKGGSWGAEPTMGAVFCAFFALSYVSDGANGREPAKTR